MMLAKDQEKLCLRETNCSVTSISTVDYVPQPVDEKSHFIRNRIFVGNFPSSATHKDISNMFRPFGEIIETNIIDSPNGNNRYGFVTFRTIASTDAVLSLYFRGREFIVKGQPVNINRALFKPKRQGSGSAPAPAITDKTKSFMTMRGQVVVAEFVNGMAYFKPLKEDEKTIPDVPVVPVQKTIGSFPPFPVFALANQFRFPCPVNMQHGFPMVGYSNVIPVPPRPPIFQSYSCNSLQSTQHSGVVPGPFLSNPCFGSLPIIR